MRGTFQMEHAVDNKVREVFMRFHTKHGGVRFHFGHGKIQLAGCCICREREDVGRFVLFAVASIQCLYLFGGYEHNCKRVLSTQHFFMYARKKRTGYRTRCFEHQESHRYRGLMPRGRRGSIKPKRSSSAVFSRFFTRLKAEVLRRFFDCERAWERAPLTRRTMPGPCTRFEK